ncbi:MAG: TonB-dependent receptor plug domain-containing protein [Myxococcales bacterium]|nr:TonB-dependent receptor plug domain-containing protein [Myxococcales bacterium]
MFFRVVMLSLVLCQGAAVAQSMDAGAEPAADIDDLSLEALLDTRVEVATRDARSTLEAPNVVLVLTREDVLASGSRDLLEVLQLVPGFTFHHDVSGVVGVAFRNIWGHEGKVLVMLDGQEINELLYSTTQFGHRVLAHSIERIELIRGPGSALYGGTAELAVINVITRQGRSLQGGEVSGRFAAGLSGLHDWSLAGSAGARHEASDVEWSVSVSGGEGRRTRRSWTDAAGTTGALANEPLDPLFLTASLSWKHLRARVLVDDQVVGSRVAFGEYTPTAETSRFRTLLADVQADLPVTSTLTLRPRLTTRLHVPWQTTERRSSFFFDKSAARVLAGLTAFWTPVETLSLSGGVETFFDHAWLNDVQLLGLQTQFGNANTVTYSNVASWVQAQWENPIVNVTAGGRLEWNSAVGVNVAPRLALTKQLGRVNVKALYGGAFRNPGIENLNLGTNVRPERTQVVEAEVGAALGDVTYVSVNGFYTLLTSPIIYGIDPETGAESYRNGGALSTAGAEAMVRLRGRRGALTVTGALAMPVVATGVDSYLVPDAVTPTLLAMPLVKLTAFGRFKFGDRFSAGGQAVFFSGRQALVTAADVTDGNLVVGQLPAGLLLSLWVGVDGLGLEGLSAQLGVGNLLDTNVVYAQPYNGGIAPIPGRNRELFLRASYAFGLGSK